MTDYHPFLVTVPESIDDLISPVVAPDASTADLKNANDLRCAFWKGIPRWKGLLGMAAAKIFLDYYKFGLYLKVEPVFPLGCPTARKWESWRPNVEVVDAFLGHYGRRREPASEL